MHTSFILSLSLLVVIAGMVLASRHKFKPVTMWNSRHAITIYGFVVYGLIAWISLKPLTEKKENDPEGLYDFEQKTFKSIPYRVLYGWGYVSASLLGMLVLLWLVQHIFFYNLGFRSD